MESGDDVEKKLRPLYTGGQGKRKELGKSLFSNEGVKFFKQAEKKWKKMYKNENMMRILYHGFEDWLNDVGELGDGNVESRGDGRQQDEEGW